MTVLTAGFSFLPFAKTATSLDEQYLTRVSAAVITLSFFDQSPSTSFSSSESVYALQPT